jgi:hypothetical protein
MVYLGWTQLLEAIRVQPTDFVSIQLNSGKMGIFDYPRKRVK